MGPWQQTGQRYKRHEGSIETAHMRGRVQVQARQGHENRHIRILPWEVSVSPTTVSVSRAPTYLVQTVPTIGHVKALRFIRLAV